MGALPSARKQRSQDSPLVPERVRPTSQTGMPEGTTTSQSKLDTWRSEKEREWADPESKLRRKHPSRESFESWLDQQCRKAVRNAATSRSRPVQAQSTDVVLSVE